MDRNNNGGDQKALRKRLERAASRVDQDGGLPTAVGQWPSPNTTWLSGGLGREPQTPIEMWLSFFPIAPMFGVRWVWFTMLAANSAHLPTPTAAGPEVARKADDESAKLSMGAPFLASSKTLSSPDDVARSTNDVPARETTSASSASTSVPPAAELAASAPTTAQAALSAAAARVRVTAPAPREPKEAPAAAKPAPSATSAGGDGVAKPSNLLNVRPDQVDDLQRIFGIGPRLEALLNELGIYRFTQLAALSPAELRWIDERLHVFKGRAERDNWVGQAKQLSSR